LDSEFAFFFIYILHNEDAFSGGGRGKSCCFVLSEPLIQERHISNSFYYYLCDTGYNRVWRYRFLL